MTAIDERQWLVLLILLMLIVRLQMALQVIMPQMFAFPPPPVPMGYFPPSPMYTAVQSRMKIGRDKNSYEIAMGVAVPMVLPRPVQFAVPAYPPPAFCMKNPRSSNCPVCPPCLCFPCTPAFFSYCSPCHQRCRCRNRDNVPIPLPHEPPSPVLGPAFPMSLPINIPHGIVVPVHQVREWIDDYETPTTSKGPCGVREKRKKTKHVRKESYYRKIKS